MKLKYLTLIVLTLTGLNAYCQQNITYVDLINDLINMEKVALTPMKGEDSDQFSSYSRASKYDWFSEKYINWDENGDSDGGPGVEKLPVDSNRNIILAEMTGPGCVKRIWSAAPGAGRVKIYLDGSDVPAVDLPFQDYFYSSNAPFNHKGLVYNSSGGCNNYIPISYQKSCKIIAERNWGMYYHIDYTTYPADTIVQTFSLKLSEKELKALNRVDDFILTKMGNNPAGKAQGEKTTVKSLKIQPDKAVTFQKLTGAGAITAIKLKLKDMPYADTVNVLRSLTIKIYWDGEKEPSVWCPIGDFFGAAPGLNQYKTLVSGCNNDGFYSYWYMPYGKSATVVISNDGDKEQEIKLSLTSAPLTKTISNYLRFHAKWHRDAFLPIEPGREIEWTILQTEGIGRFCGTMLHIWNPKGGWWGEGDEMFYVDGERFPSWFGTGSEDYFGYAWCNPALFNSAYCAQTHNDKGNQGNVSVCRYQIVDNVPFQQSFTGTIEKYFKNDYPTLYAGVAYWYLSPNGVDYYKEQPITERIGYFGKPVEVYKIQGALEAEDLKIREITAGETVVQSMQANKVSKWSNDMQIFWYFGKPNDSITFTLPVEKTGEYEIKIKFCKAGDYGIFQTYLDDKPIGGPIDLYNKEIVLSGELSFGSVKLKKGGHKLKFVIVGSNSKANGSTFFGMDYVLLK